MRRIVFEPFLGRSPLGTASKSATTRRRAEQDNANWYCNLQYHRGMSLGPKACVSWWLSYTLDRKKGRRIIYLKMFVVVCWRPCFCVL